MDTQLDSNKTFLKKSNTKMYICNTELSNGTDKSFEINWKIKQQKMSQVTEKLSQFMDNTQQILVLKRTLPLLGIFQKCTYLGAQNKKRRKLKQV